MTNVSVGEDSRGQGIGKALLEESIQKAKASWGAARIFAFVDYEIWKYYQSTSKAHANVLQNLSSQYTRLMQTYVGVPSVTVSDAALTVRPALDFAIVLFPEALLAARLDFCLSWTIFQEGLACLEASSLALAGCPGSVQALWIS